MSGPPTVLLVDDSAVERGVFGNLLRGAGFNVEIANDGRQAIDLLSDDRFDLALIDLNMPDVDGFQVLQHLRLKKTALQAPAIILTASDTSGDILRALRLGANDYIVKTNEPEVMLARVRAQIDARQRSQQLEGMWNAIKKSQIELQTLIDAVNDPLYVVDQDGDIQRVNRAGAALLGVSFRELLGQSLWRHLPALNPQTTLSLSDLALEVSGRHFRVQRLGAMSPVGDRDAIVLHDTTVEYATQAALENRVAERTADLRRLAARIEQVRESERSKLARELHDEFGQLLTAAKLDAAWIRQRVGSPDGKLEDTLESLVATINHMAKRIHDIATDLRPSVLDKLGLFPALAWLAESVQKRSKLKIELQPPERTVQVDEATATALFRVLQESLTNITRHAHARSVAVRFSLQDNGLGMIIDDDGVGFSQSALQNETRSGIEGMRQRIEALGGAFSASNRPQSGVRVSVWLPLGNREGQGA